MGINTAWINERHETKQQVSDVDMILSRLATARWFNLTHTVCLRFIEPWGDTVFNQSQIPVLLAELQSEIASQDNPKIRHQLKCVTNLVEMAVNQTHTYIKFIGD